jgi:hypothetical protein
MNTNNIKSFAKQARLLLMEGVKQRLLYWGFDEQGNSTDIYFVLKFLMMIVFPPNG